MTRWFRFIVLFSLLPVLSCTKVSLFNSPLETDHEIEVRSLPEGGLLIPGESVSFIIHSPLEDSEALNLEIVLSTAGGVEIWNTQIASPLLNEDLELLLPDLETGQYRLNFIITQEEGSSNEKGFDFFYAVGEYKILGIRSYPPTPYPSSETILKADLIYPTGSDPYLRWRQDGEILAAGFLSGGMDNIIWSAPDEAGVYTLEVELFPAQPSGGSNENLFSSVSMTASLYVSTQQILSDNDLSPESSYFSLFHFNGALRDFGVQGKTENPDKNLFLELFGTPVFTQQGDHFGYRLTPGSGLRYPRGILPLTEGRLAPFTLTLAIVPENENAEKTLLSSGDAEQGFVFSLLLDKDGQILAVLESRGERYLIPSGIAGLRLGEESFISLSVLPGEQDLTASWYLNGLPVSVRTQAVRLEDLPDAGRTVIGGDLSMVITELGVFFQDEQERRTIDPAIYAAAKERELGSHLIIADGFDGTYASAPAWIDGPHILENGLLRLSGMASLTLPAFEPSPEGIGLRMVFRSPLPPEALVSFAWEGVPVPFLILPVAESALVSTAEGARAVPGDALLSILFTDTTYSLTTAAGPQSAAIPAERPEGAWLIVRLENAHRASAEETHPPLDLEQVILYRDGTKKTEAETAH
jgi:hypothetical protein